MRRLYNCTAVAVLLVLSLASPLSASAGEPVDILKAQQGAALIEESPSVPIDRAQNLPRKTRKSQRRLKKEQPVQLLQNLTATKELKPIVEAIVSKNTAKTSIAFVWPKPVKAAAYFQDDKLWIIFDEESNVRFVERKQQYSSQQPAPDIKNLKQLNISSAGTFVVADVKIPHDKRSFIAYRTENAWIFEIANEAAKLRSDAIKLEEIKCVPIFGADLVAELHCAIRENSVKEINFLEPFGMREMSVVPLAGSSKHVTDVKDYVDLNVLETVQGIAIERESDDLQWRFSDKKAAIFMEKQGLDIALDVLSIQQQDSPYFIPYIAQGVVLNLANFVRQGQSFLEEERVLKNEIVNIRPSLKPSRRLALTALYFANGFYGEAQNVLELAQADDPNLSKRYEVLLLQAALEFCVGNFHKAKEAFELIGLEDVAASHREEMQFWNSLISYANARTFEHVSLYKATQLFINFRDNFLHHYTPQLLAKAGVMVLGHNVKAETIPSVTATLNVIQSFEGLGRSDQNQLRYDIARYYARAGKNDLAITHFNQCIADAAGNLHYNRCQYRRGLLLKEMGSIDDELLIEILERVLLRWRGDEFSLRVLTHLHDLYLSRGDTLKALRAQQEMKENYSDFVSQLQISNEMGRHFADFFLKKRRHDPMQSFELFLEFNHLLPVGVVGDEIISRVVDELGELDLLEQRAELLEHQVKNRLTGLQKQRALNKLAATYLENDQPDKAAEIAQLDTDNQNMSQEMRDARRRLAAKALYRINREKEALSLLRDDFSLAADLIKSEIFWNKKDWKSFNDFSEPYIYSIRDAQDALTRDQFKIILKQAMSYFYLKEYDLLEALYVDFQERVAKNKRYLDSFKLLLNIAKAQGMDANEAMIFDAEELYKLTNELVKELNDV